MAENILNDDAIITPAWTTTATFVVCLVTGVAMATLFVATATVYKAVVGSLLLVLSSILASVLPFVRAGLFVSLASPVLVVVTLFMARFAIEKRRASVWQRQLENARQVTMESMASVAETRDPETGAHIKRQTTCARSPSNSSAAARIRRR